MSERHYSKVLIIGAGPAGYTAAITQRGPTYTRSS